MFVRVTPRGVGGALAKLMRRMPAPGPTFDTAAGIPLREIDDVAAAFTGARAGRLDEVLDHPELYRAEPRLRRIRVDMTRPDLADGNWGAAMTLPGFRKIKVAASLRDDEAMRTLLHEVQHEADSLGRVPYGRGGIFSSLEVPWHRRAGENRAMAVEERFAERRMERQPSLEVDPFEQPRSPSGHAGSPVYMQNNGRGELHPEDVAYGVYGIGVGGLAGLASYGAHIVDASAKRKSNKQKMSYDGALGALSRARQKRRART